MRGKLQEWIPVVFDDRITPAGAGKTAGAVGTRAGARDHPRRCGENDVPQYSRQRPHGSPPQVRGKPTKKMCPAPCIRITPAGAGKTQRAQRANPALKDHPRRCGENRIRRTRRRPTLGSPPQVRGKHEPCRAHGLERRITPAGAGKTRTAESIHVSAKDHPRRCGENARTMRSNSFGSGSPPQVRGKLVLVCDGRVVAGITPAGAGKTPYKSIEADSLTDHPRRCGENFQTYCIADPDVGSPPQVRGKPLLSLSTTYSPRITPAGAGKTI